MALPGETILLGASPYCCGELLDFQVLRSGAGWYIGTFCPNCGPYSRESKYLQTEAQAIQLLSEWNRRKPMTWPRLARSDGRIV